MRLYIAGPITGVPNFRDAFNEMAAKVMALGHQVENPCDNSGDESQSHQFYMKLGLAQMLTCDGIVLIDGWLASKGARFEAKVAEMCGMPTYSLNDGHLVIYHFAAEHAAKHGG